MNPVRLLEAENLYNKTSDVWSTTSLEIGNVLPGLKFVSRFTYNLQNYYYKNSILSVTKLVNRTYQIMFRSNLIVWTLGRQRIH